MQSIELGLKNVQTQLSHYGVSIETLRQKMQNLSKMNQANEWQSYINQGLDENWDFNDEEDEELKMFSNMSIPYGIPYVKSISRLGINHRDGRGTEKWVKDKLEELQFKTQDKKYDECATIFQLMTESISTHKDKIVSMIDEAYANYIQELSNTIMITGSEESIEALIK